MGWRRRRKPLDHVLHDLLARVLALGLITMGLVGPCEVIAKAQFLISFVIRGERPPGPVHPVVVDTALELLFVLIRIGFVLVGLALFIASFKPWRGRYEE